MQDKQLNLNTFIYTYTKNLKNYLKFTRYKNKFGRELMQSTNWHINIFFI